MVIELRSQNSWHQFERQTPKWIESLRLARKFFAFPFFQARKRSGKPRTFVAGSRITGSIDDVDGMQDGVAPGRLWQVSVHQSRHGHLANGAHVALRGMVHPLSIRSGKALLNSFAGTECCHGIGLINTAVVGKQPRYTISAAKLGFHSSHKFLPNVLPLGMRFDQKSEDTAR